MNLPRGIALVALIAFLLSATGPLRAQDDIVLPSPRPADYAQILANDAEAISVFRYALEPRIHVLDFSSLTAQGDMFNRVVALIERTGSPRDRVLTKDELARFIQSVGKTPTTFAFGNDFLVGELVVFFNLADHGKVPLNAMEVALRDFLQQQKLIVKRFGFYQATDGGAVILSIPRVNAGGNGEPAVTPLTRKTILRHELAHGEFYANRAYADHCRRFWNETMTERQRSAFREFLARSSYDPGNEEMMINESQAYLMHTPDPRAFNPAKVGLSESEITALRHAFMQGVRAIPAVSGSIERDR